MLMGVSPHQRLTLVCPEVGVSPTRSLQRKHQPTAPSRLAYEQSKPSTVGVCPTWSPCYADGSVPHQCLTLIRPEVGVSPTQSRQRKH